MTASSADGSDPPLVLAKASLQGHSSSCTWYGLSRLRSCLPVDLLVQYAHTSFTMARSLLLQLVTDPGFWHARGDVALGRDWFLLSRPR